MLGIVRLMVENRIPGTAVVGCLPDPSVIWGHVKDVRLAGDAGNRDGPAAAEGADQPPVKFLKHRRVIRLGRECERKKAERGELETQESLLHVGPLREVRINHDWWVGQRGEYSGTIEAKKQTRLTANRGAGP